MDCLLIYLVSKPFLIGTLEDREIDECIYYCETYIRLRRSIFLTAKSAKTILVIVHASLGLNSAYSAKTFACSAVKYEF